ncbi:uncharacterized protein LOC108087840 isoform X2 [Drosophila ficusphila]|uniref:uncharacterized protein LOC108087840 isoform X2 n=1 Tax=Drosophila ficusphila TaxID=30025 RepID=UPI001C8A56DC|nr:uncharacterized protein LOC108087840 isoform X2 [Drosophila ficusphila]
MKHFVNDKIMSHFRSSKHKKNDESVGRSQADCSPEEGAIDPCKKPRPVVQRTCPGSETAPDNMYVLKNCDRCQDYTVQPCGKNCKCQKRKTNCSGQCEVAAREKSQAQSQESFPGTRKSIHKMTGKPSKTSFNSESQRRMGGMGPICQLCGLEEIRQPGQSMCPVCSEKIQAAVDNYYVQCQGQCQQGTGQPCPYQQNNNQFQQGTGETCPYEQQSQQQPAGEWQQLQGSPLGNQQQPLGDQPFNIIVLQDCNNSSLIDQLTTAINRGGGQVHVPQQYSDYNYQNPNQQYNPLSGYIDYEYVDYQQRFDQERMDRNGYRNGMSPWSTSSRDAYEDEHMSCNSYDCPARMPENYQRQGPFNEPRSDNSNQSYANSCTCNCDFCRKGFETKEKLAMLIAQALEIFIGNNKAKAKGSEMKPKKEKEKEKGGKIR